MTEALIFDFDGLIADTESAIYEAWAALYHSQGETLHLKDYVHCVGSTFGQFDPMAELERRLGRTLAWEPLLEAKDAVIRAGHQDLTPLPGVRELLAEAAVMKVPCAIASSSTIDWINRWLATFELAPAFRAVWTRDRVKEAKPSPELFLGAASELGLPPARCIVLEDSRNGLRAAQQAGSPCIIVPSPVTLGSDFTGAHGILPSLAGVSTNDLLNYLRSPK